MAKDTNLEQLADNKIFSTRRLEALTDGVFAIAMTLLILDLKASDIGEVANSSEFINSLMNNLTGFPSFVISFLLLGSMWAVHSRQFEYIQKTDRHLTMINTIRLLVVVLIPFTTSIAGGYQDILVGRLMLPINFMILAIVSYWQWTYAVDPKNGLTSKNLTPKIRELSELRNKAIIYLSVAIVFVAAFVGEIAFVLITLSLPVERLLYSRGKHRQPAN